MFKMQSKAICLFKELLY